jgi:hypothetical protein
LAKWVDVERLAKSVADLGLGVRGIQNERSAVMLERGVRDIVSWIPEPSTLLLTIVALGVVGVWRKWGG